MSSSSNQNKKEFIVIKNDGTVKTIMIDRTRSLKEFQETGKCIISLALGNDSKGRLNFQFHLFLAYPLALL